MIKSACGTITYPIKTEMKRCVCFALQKKRTRLHSREVVHKFGDQRKEEKETLITFDTKLTNKQYV